MSWVSFGSSNMLLQVVYFLAFVHFSPEMHSLVYLIAF